MKTLSGITVACAIAAAFFLMQIVDQRDAAIRRAEAAERDAADLLKVLNGKAAFVEIRPNGDRVYTTFKTRKVTRKPLILAEAR